MFDGPGTLHLDPGGLGVVLDLSGLDINSPAMPLVLMTATGWLQEFLVCPGPQRLQITDELWVGAGDRHFVRHMQRCQKLGRTFGVANIQIAHKVTDAAAQTADGTAESKIAAGLLADTDTKIILRQDPEQLDHAQRAFGLTATERGWIGSLVKGRALWLVGGERAVVQHHLARHEQPLVDTDQRLASATGRWDEAEQFGQTARDIFSVLESAESAIAQQLALRTAIGLNQGFAPDVLDDYERLDITAAPSYVGDLPFLAPVPPSPPSAEPTKPSPGTSASRPSTTGTRRCSSHW